MSNHSHRMVTIKRSHFVAFVILCVLLIGLPIVYAWTGPGSSPPNSNVFAPVHVGAGDQFKTATLGVNSLVVDGNAILSGATRYLNFNATPGSGGYGFRDNAGVMEFKNSTGGWTSIGSLSGGDNLGNHTATQALNMGTSKITNLGTPTAAADAATKAYVDAGDASSGETDPQVGTLSAGLNVCRSNSGNTAVICDLAPCGSSPHGTITSSACSCCGGTSGYSITQCRDGVQTSVAGCPSCGKCSCFTFDTLVTMADGSQKDIHTIQIGEEVRGANGTINTVLGLDRPYLWKGKPQHLVHINDSKAFMTDNHPVMTTEGWKAVNLEYAEREAFDQLEGKITALTIGDVIIGRDGQNIVIDSITLEPQTEEGTRLYNLYVSGDHLYYANGMLVHGVVPNKGGQFRLSNEHEGE